MKTSDFYYNLPKERIAQTPVTPRDHARLLVYNRQDKSIAHRHFYDLADYLTPGDCLIVNDTKVLPARLLGRRKTGGAMEVLLLRRLSQTGWQVMCRPAKRARVGEEILFAPALRARVTAVLEEGLREVEFLFEGVFETLLDELGQMPLPPYITERLADKNRYQTVYAREAGSAAAPTAGLHFTPGLLEKIRAKGVAIAPVLLHVGLGTFRPVQAESIEGHHMHSEYYEMPAETQKILRETRARGGRIFAVGTTSARVLETAALSEKEAPSGFTDIFLYPGCTFRSTDCLITNFHLPESTLLMLVSALAGREEMLRVYNEAVKEEYRFFSFGDAMLILGTAP